MFGMDIPPGAFREHRWRDDLVRLGTVPSDYVHEVSDGCLRELFPDYPITVEVNKRIAEGGYTALVSIGQVVPHEVAGMANGFKNVLVGGGGPDTINKSHFLGAVYGMERIMGRADNPVRQLMNYASDHFARELPVVYVQTVISKNDAGDLVARGLFIGDDEECFLKASELSLRVNFEMMDREIRKAVVYLDPSEFKSTWLGNKAVYRTRMAIADGGELIVLAPGVKEFGEDPEIGRASWRERA